MSLIAVAQFCSGDDIQQNIEFTHSLAAEAAGAGAHAIFLPECFALMQTSRAQLRDSAEQIGDGPIQRAMAECARLHNILIFAGSLPTRSADPKRVFNTSMVFAPRQDQPVYYHKAHLFDVSLDTGETYLESAYTMAGDRAVVTDCELGTVGLSVCYDLRFPELYRVLADKGAEILLVPSAFSPSTGDAHWHTLLRARAIENFCYVIAAAQVGRHPSGRKTWGHSLVVDPWGRIIGEKAEGTGLLFSEIDRNEVARARRQMPSLEHRAEWL